MEGPMAGVRSTKGASIDPSRSLDLSVPQIGEIATKPIALQDEKTDVILPTCRPGTFLRASNYVPTLPDRKVEDLVAGFLHSLSEPPAKKQNSYYIVHIAVELAPVVKVGGLADVISALGRALQKNGHRIEIILPKYDCMDDRCIKNFKKLDKEFYSFFDGRMHKNSVWSGIVEGLSVYFIETFHPSNFFCRGKVYNEPDDPNRFTYFSRAALDLLLNYGKRPDIIHCHDWTSAIVAPLYRFIYAELGLGPSRLAFTCHNFEPQGKSEPEVFTSCGLNVKGLIFKDLMKDDLEPNKVNLLKAALVYSDFVTTVSPTYAREVCTQEGGMGLNLTLAKYTKNFCGILNGIDDEVWNPANDVFLKSHYTAEDLSGKEVNKNNLRKRLGMAFEDIDARRRPLVGCVTRLVPQKGVDLIREAIFHTLEMGGQFILQGSSQIPSIKAEFDKIAQQFERHPHVRLVLKSDEVITHSIFAACDMFIIPSIFEPCGLTQMYAMRYGALPIVRKTGGLADCVFDVDDKSVPIEKRNGFQFSSPDKTALTAALDRAILYYRQRPHWWKIMTRKTMRLNFSWDAAPVDQYVKLYKQAIERDVVKKSS